MGNPRYTARRSLLVPESTYEVTDAELLSSADGAEQRLPLAELALVRIFTAPAARSPLLGNTSFGGFDQIVLRAKDGRQLVLTSQHFRAVGQFEDRRATFVPFVEALLQRVAAVNPDVRCLAGMPPVVFGLWLAVLVLLAALLLFGILMVWDAAMGRGTTIGLIFGLAFTAGVAFSLVGVGRAVRRGRSRAFDPRQAGSWARGPEDPRGTRGFS